MNTQACALDYIRLASWAEGAYTEIISRIMRAWPDDWKKSRWLQYKGWRKEGFFIGHGEQKKRSHTIINVSGSLSQQLLPTLQTLEGWYCTRIDLQITVKHPMGSGQTLALVRDECDTSNTTLIESQENHTLYLGSRTSELFTRLYEKFLLSNPYLRLEFELKGQRSRAAWQAIIADEPLDRIFTYYLDRSRLPDYAKAWYQVNDAIATQESMRKEQLQSSKKKLEWLKSLDPAVTRYMNDHDISDEVKVLIRVWAKHADYLDNN